MQRKSFVTTAALAGGLALGLVLGPAVADNASAQTASPSASATASASASADASMAASTVSPMDTLRSLFLDNVAEALSIDRTALDCAITTAASSTTDEAVANGTLTQEQADALEARIQSGNFGFGGRGGHGGFGVRVDGVKDAIVTAAAQTLNLTEDELQTQLRSGQTLAQIAQAQGTTEQAVIDAALAAAKIQLDEAVAAGTVTQAQADAAYAQLQERGSDLLFGGRGGPDGGYHERDGETMPTTPDASPSASTATDA